MTVEFFEDKTVYLNIKQVAKILGIHAQTIRNWEKQELIEPIRIGGHQRMFTGESLTRLEKIMDLKEKGWNIKAIKYFIENEENKKES